MLLEYLQKIWWVYAVAIIGLFVFMGVMAVLEGQGII